MCRKEAVKGEAMERLTKSELVNGFPVCYPKNNTGLPEYVMKHNPYRDIVEKLKHYEDLQEQGRLLELPCAVGDTVYVVERSQTGSPMIAKTIADSFYCASWMLDEKFGRSIFPTLEQAEAVMKRMEDENEAD